MGVILGQNIINDNIKIWYDAADPKCYPGTGSSVFDLSPNNNTGSLIRITFNTLNGGSFYNSATSGTPNIFIPASDSNDVGNNMSMEAWVKFDYLDYSGSSGYLYSIYRKGNPDQLTPNAGIYFMYDNRTNGSSFVYTCFGNTAGGYAGGGNNFSGAQYNQTFSTGVWNHIAVTINNNSGSLFINGIKKGLSKTFSNLQVSTASATTTVGLITPDGTTKSFFSVASFKLYNRALSDTEIFNNYNAVSSRFTPIQTLITPTTNTNTLVTNGLVLDYDAADQMSYPGSGLTWSDIQNRFNGTLINGVSYSSSLNNGAMIFDGVNNYVSVVTSTTYSAWTFNAFLYTRFTQSLTTQGILLVNNTSEGTLSSQLSYFHGLNSILISTSSNIYVAGQMGGYQRTNQPCVVAMSSTGSIFSTFSAYGDVNVLQSNNFYELSDGILVCGTNIGGAGLSKFNKTTGAAISSPSSGNSNITNNMVVDEASNSIWLIGEFSTLYQSIAVNGILKIRLDNYNIDTGFDTTTGFNSVSGPTKAALDSNKDLYVVGSFTTYKGTSAVNIVKIKGTSSLIDASFNYGTGFVGATNDVKIQSDGKIVIVGNFTSYNGTTRNRIIRLNTDGTIDSGFTYSSGLDGLTYCAEIQSDGKILVGGNFTTYNGTARNRIMRLNTNGTIDSGFTYSSGFNSYVKDIKVQPDGKIVVIGDLITTYSGVTISTGITRLNSDGTIDNTFDAKTGFDTYLYRDDIFIYTSGVSGAYTGMNWTGNISGGNGRTLWTSPSRSGFYQNKWHQYTFTVDNSNKTMRTYIDGVLISTNTTTIGANTYTLKPNSFLRTSLVNCGALQFYGRSLTASEVLQNYNTLKSRFGL